MALDHPVDGVGAAASAGNVTAGSPLRSCLAIPGSVVTFALLIERAGFLAAVTLTVLLASFASRELSLGRALMLAAIVAVVMAVLFVGVLNQPFTLITGW
jgi:hypothetical protein